MIVYRLSNSFDGNFWQDEKMDTFTFAMSVVLMMIALQFNQNWLVFGVISLMILTMRSFSGTIIMIATGVVLYLFKESLHAYWPFLLFGLIILALAFGGGGKEEAEYYPPDPYAGMLGGYGGQQV